MEISLLITGAMALLSPLLTKAGEKAAETIGEKLADKATEKGVWQRIKGLFVGTGEEAVIEQIENKTIASPADVALIEEKLTMGLKARPEFAEEIQTFLNLTPANVFEAQLLLKSMERARIKLGEYYELYEEAGPEVKGGYGNLIKTTSKDLSGYEEKFKRIVSGQ
jgi:hypothetical protein